MNKLMTVGVCAAVAAALAFTGSAATYYAKPDGADDATCADETNAGSISNAIVKALTANNNTVVLLDGDYDCSGISNPTKTSYAFYLNKTITIKSKSDNPDTVCLVGSGTMDKKKACIYTAATVTLQALTIANFHSSASGSGAYCGANTLTITNCTFDSCRSTASGGALYQQYNLKLRLYNCRFRKCSSGNGNAVCYCHGGATQAYDCEITDCFVDNTNGGCVVYDGTWTRCTWSGCYTTGSGANAYGAVGASAKLNNCVVSNCWCAGANGPFYKCTVTDTLICDMPKNGVYYQGSFDRCVFKDNQTYLTCNAGVLRNCLIVGNSYEAGGNPKTLVYGGTLQNNTFVGNYQPAGTGWNRGGIVGGGTRVENCIFAENTGSRVFASGSGSGIYLTNCLYSAGAASGSYTHAANPVELKPVSDGVSEFDQVKFVGASDKGLPYYSLQRKSPAVDVGTNLTYTVESVDLAGNPRVVSKGMTLAKNPNAIVDLGCYENLEPNPGLMLLLR